MRSRWHWILKEFGEDTKSALHNAKIVLPFDKFITLCAVASEEVGLPLADALTLQNPPVPEDSAQTEYSKQLCKAHSFLKGDK
jgi:hypothetical protein